MAALRFILGLRLNPVPLSIAFHFGLGGRLRHFGLSRNGFLAEGLYHFLVWVPPLVVCNTKLCVILYNRFFPLSVTNNAIRNVRTKTYNSLLEFQIPHLI